jgi:hypothetical protein
MHRWGGRHVRFFRLIRLLKLLNPDKDLPHLQCYIQNSHVSNLSTYDYKGSYTNPVLLASEQTFGLEQDLLVGLLLGDAVGKVGGVGVDLSRV